MWATLGLALAIVLTVMVYSYLVGDNVIFRLAEHLLVGVSVGWAALQIIFNLLIPAVERVRDADSVGALVAYLVPLLLGVIILFRPLRAARPITNLVMAFVIGTVSALALAGAVAGTIFPQVGATMLPLGQGGASEIIGGLVLVVGTVLALWYFKFTTSKKAATETSTAPAGAVALNVRLAGRWAIMLAFGAIFGSLFLTYFAALLDRLMFFLKISF